MAVSKAGVHTNYPEWAPDILVECHKDRGNIASTLPSGGMKMLSSHRQYVLMFLFPTKERVALLGRLLTDPRMKNVWNALARRISIDQEFCDFFSTCNSGLDCWRKDLKWTASERKACSQEIQDTVAKLDDLMKKSGLLNSFKIQSLMSDYAINEVLKGLGSSTDVLTGRITIGLRFPTISEVLIGISNEARQYDKEESTVKRPNSENADIHYFVRNLSQYLRKKYKQPLHEVVSATTEVVFNRRDISSDYVRELVRRYP